MGVVSNKVDITDLQKGAGGGGGDLPGRVTALEAETVQLAEGLALVQTSVRSLDLESVQLAEGLAHVQTSVASGRIPMQTGNKIAFGVDGYGNYGYYKVGADTVTPFLTGGGEMQTKSVSMGVSPNVSISTRLDSAPKLFYLYATTDSANSSIIDTVLFVKGVFENDEYTITAGSASHTSAMPRYKDISAHISAVYNTANNLVITSNNNSIKFFTECNYSLDYM